jgi:hypothetical protein
MTRTVLNSSPTSNAARNKMAWNGRGVRPSIAGQVPHKIDEVVMHEQVRRGAPNHGSCDDIGWVMEASVEAGQKDDAHGMDRRENA